MLEPTPDECLSESPISAQETGLGGHIWLTS